MNTIQEHISIIGAGSFGSNGYCFSKIFTNHNILLG